MQKKVFLTLGMSCWVLSSGLLFSPLLPGQEVTRISALSALHKYNTGKVIVADAMNARTYKKYHILGAISLPGDGKADLDRIREGRLPIPKDQGIIVYCD
jgi:rhodanese-related sulfurtransferase